MVCLRPVGTIARKVKKRSADLREGAAAAGSADDQLEWHADFGRLDRPARAGQPIQDQSCAELAELTVVAAQCGHPGGQEVPADGVVERYEGNIGGHLAAAAAEAAQGAERERVS